MLLTCNCCESKNIKKNGHTHYGKQNYMCKDCGRQFVKGGQDWFISDTKKDLVDKLLLERISLAGITRVTGISKSWISTYLKGKYGDLPDDLNADLSLPKIEEYLADRMDEEIDRLAKKKLNRANSISKYQKMN